MLILVRRLVWSYCLFRYNTHVDDKSPKTCKSLMVTSIHRWRWQFTINQRVCIYISLIDHILPHSVGEKQTEKLYRSHCFGWNFSRPWKYLKWIFNIQWFLGGYTRNQFQACFHCGISGSTGSGSLLSSRLSREGWSKSPAAGHLNAQLMALGFEAYNTSVWVCQVVHFDVWHDDNIQHEVLPLGNTLCWMSVVTRWSLRLTTFWCEVFRPYIKAIWY